MNFRHNDWLKAGVIFLRVVAGAIPFSPAVADVANEGRKPFLPKAQNLLQDEFPGYVGYPTPGGCEFEKAANGLTATITVDLDTTLFQMNTFLPANERGNSIRKINAYVIATDVFDEKVFVNGEERDPGVSWEARSQWKTLADRANKICDKMKLAK